MEELDDLIQNEVPKECGKHFHPLSGKVILLNAPKGAGKDVIGQVFNKNYCCTLGQFKDPLYKVAFSLTNNLDWETFMDYNTDRVLKETPNVNFHNRSPRDHLIYVSENIVKPHFGKDFFGLKALQHVNNYIKHGVVFTDSGFVEEAQPLIDKYGSNVYIIQFTGQGSTSFEGDSRNFIEPEGATIIKMPISNDECTVEFFTDRIVEEIYRADFSNSETFWHD